MNNNFNDEYDDYDYNNNNNSEYPDNTNDNYNNNYNNNYGNYNNESNNGPDTYNKYGRYGSNKVNVDNHYNDYREEEHKEKKHFFKKREKKVEQDVNFNNNYDYDRYNDYNNYNNDRPYKKPKNGFKKFIIFLILLIIIILGFSIYVILNRQEYTLRIYNEEHERKNLTCKSYKIFSYETGCKIQLPPITGDQELDLGYSNENDLTTEYNVADQVLLMENKSVYEVAGRIVTVKFIKDKADFVEYNQATCLIKPDEESCDIRIPYLNTNGQVRLSFSREKDKVINSYDPNYIKKVFFYNRTYSFTEDTVLYETNEGLITRNIPVSENFRYDNTFVEVDNTCSKAQVDELKALLEDVKKNVPALTRYFGKLSLMSPTYFASSWPTPYQSNAVGITYYPLQNNYAVIANIDILCSYIGTAVVHELTHRFDFEYRQKTGNYLSKDIELVALYNKYKTTSPRPFRDYAYTDSGEFLAEAYKYYYYTFVNYNQKEGTTNYPEDVKQFIIKYIK